MTLGEAETFNARTRPLGYETKFIGTAYFIQRLDSPDRMEAFREREHLEQFIKSLEELPSWRLDLTHGDVDFDRETGIVTPRDGSDPFSVRDADGWSGSRKNLSDDMQLNATFMHIYRQQRPALGGAWHKSSWL